MASEINPNDYIGIVFSVAKKITGWRNWRMPEATSDGAAGLMYAVQRYDASRGKHPAAYIQSCVRGFILTGFRKRNRPIVSTSKPIERLPLHGFASGQDERDNAILPLSGERDPSAFAELQDDSLKLRAAIKTLSRERRLLILLRFFRGWTCEQIAARLGRSVHAVEQVLWKSKRQLRTRLREEDFF